MIGFGEQDKMDLGALNKVRSLNYISASEGWRFLTNHARVLLFFDRHKRVTIREVSDALDLAEPSVRRIISQLSEAGYVKKRLERGVNLYVISAKMPMRSRELSQVPVSVIINALHKALDSTQRSDN